MPPRTQLYEVGVNLRDKQIDKLLTGKGMVNLRLDKNQVGGKKHKILVNSVMLRKMDKAHQSGKGLVLRLNEQNLKQIRGMGFWNDFAKGFTSVFDVANPILSAIDPRLGGVTSLGNNLIKGLAGIGQGVRASGVRASGVRASGVRASGVAAKKNVTKGRGLVFLR